MTPWFGMSVQQRREEVKRMEREKEARRLKWLAASARQEEIDNRRKVEALSLSEFKKLGL